MPEHTQDWDTDSWRAQTKPCAHQDPGERSSDRQETDPDLPVSAQGSPAEAWAGGGLLQGQGTECSSACMGPFEGGPQYLNSVQFSRSVLSDSATPWTAVRQASLSITNYWSLLKLMSIESVMPSNHLILCDPLLLPPSIIPSIRVFSSESVFRIGWPEYWSFSFSITPSNEYSGLISFWLDLLAVQGTLKNLLQHHSPKASILRCLLSS